MRSRGSSAFAFIRVLYGSEDVADRLWRGPAWARPAAGGALLGLLLLAVPQMYGVGYPVLSRAVEGHYVIAFVLVLLVAKVVATSLTIAIGGSGGVFAPSLFMGAMLGSAFGQAAHAALPQLTAPSGAYALVGMGAVFAGAARAPITAVLIIFELTGEYTIILPLMFAIVLATAISRRLSGRHDLHAQAAPARDPRRSPAGRERDAYGARRRGHAPAAGAACGGRAARGGARALPPRGVRAGGRAGR